ncbi:MAG: DUF2089 domain-containing protein [Chloroflexi bacterium]|nr:DUF2089 domain-containing protein [Chloroflexota bacterium]
MRKLLEKCPACTGELVVTQQTCVSCGTMVVGEFTPNIFSQLSPEDLHFLELFVKNKGNVKEIEREIGMSYWTIRNRINELVEALGFENKHVEPTVPEETLRQNRQDILARVDSGEIDVNKAATLLKQIK